MLFNLSQIRYEVVNRGKIHTTYEITVNIIACVKKIIIGIPIKLVLVPHPDWLSSRS